jgi:hypothetical protein
MLDDGTLILQLAAIAPDGTQGDAVIRVHPDQERYASMQAHLGEIPPGGSVKVLPFPMPVDDGFDWA